MLTVIVFLILGVTGALLLFHFQPIFGDCPPAAPNTTYVPAATCNSAFNSVSSINNQVNWGFLIRNIHYQASNAMVLLAVMHMFYQYFAGRYKLRYEILWVTGIILGVVTIIEAYTGYDLIFNIRGQLAINIGQTLTYYTPVLGANLAQIIFGFSFNDLTIRFYAFHVFIIPIIMLAIMSIHLPKNLVLDIPVASAITGMILILGGLFPVEVGVRYDPNQLTQITFPEWSIDHGDFSSPVEEGHYCEDEHEDSRDYSPRYEGLQALGPDECVETGEVPLWKSNLRQLVGIITHSHFDREEPTKNQNHPCYR